MNLKFGIIFSSFFLVILYLYSVILNTDIIFGLTTDHNIHIPHDLFIILSSILITFILKRFVVKKEILNIFFTGLLITLILLSALFIVDFFHIISSINNHTFYRNLSLINIFIVGYIVFTTILFIYLNKKDNVSNLGNSIIKKYQLYWRNILFSILMLLILFTYTSVYNYIDLQIILTKYNVNLSEIFGYGFYREIFLFLLSLGFGIIIGFFTILFSKTLNLDFHSFLLNGILILLFGSMIYYFIDPTDSIDWLTKESINFKYGTRVIRDFGIEKLIIFWLLVSSLQVSYFSLIKNNTI